MTTGLTLYDEFAGAGGSTQGAAAVPGVEPVFAANHNKLAVETHSTNFPHVDHYCGDVVAADITRFPRADIFWASPACPPWTDARGRKRDFDRSTWQSLPGFDDPHAPDEQTMRARALMEEIPRYLRHWQGRGRPILAGVVENVIQCRKWDQWSRWIGEIRALGYGTRVIAINSMHARPVRTSRAPQSRDRLYVAYWLRSLGRIPDFDKWLRPRAWCPSCEQIVDAVQVFKNPEVDMGRYGVRNQYLYRCPKRACRGTVVEPETLPALAAIDLTIPGVRIGDRDTLGMPELKPNTRARILAGIRRFWRPVHLEAAGHTFARPGYVRAWPVDEPFKTLHTTDSKAIACPPLLVPTGGSWRRDPASTAEPMAARTTRENDGVATLPLLVPVEGRDGHQARPVNEPARTQTARNETGIAVPPFLVPLRGGGDQGRARDVADPLATVTASGNHHGLVTGAMVMRNNTPRGNPAQMCTGIDEPLRTMTSHGHQSLVTWQQMMVPYYSNGTARAVTSPLGTQPTKDRWAIAGTDDTSGATFDPVDIDLDDVLFRMLEPDEIGRAMAFAADYVVLGPAKRDIVRQYGNAVTPPVAEVIVSALVEAITGEALLRDLAEAA